MTLDDLERLKRHLCRNTTCEYDIWSVNAYVVAIDVVIKVKIKNNRLK